MKTIRVFVSSPGDVREERELTQRAIDLLRIELAGKVALHATFWEDVPLSATGSFQPQLPRGSEFDIVICLMWSTLGTPIAERRADGSTYESGTVFEFENAISAAQRDERKTVLFYHRTSPITVLLESADLDERRRRLKAVHDYIAEWFAPAADGSLPRAFRRYSTPQEYASLVQRHLRGQIEKLAPREDGLVPAEVVWTEESPFRGLQSFEFEHAAIFRGRGAAVAEITAGLEKKAAEGCAFALILGMSGGGKSSVARAGVVPQIVFYESLPAGHAWRRAVVCPGDVPGQPWIGLANALTNDKAIPELLTSEQGEETFSSLLQRSSQAAAGILIGVLRSRKLRLVLLVDQLEEIFTLSEFDDALRHELLQFLGTLARSGVVWVLTTLRSDYYAAALATPALAALKADGSWTDLQVPKQAEIAQMIRYPAHAAGLRYEQRDGRRLDDVLLEEATQNPRALPLLQFTLEQLYARRTPGGSLTLEAYEEMGGLKGSIASKARSVFDDIAPEDRRSLSRVLASAATVELEHREVIPRRRFPRAHFASDPEALRLIDAFVEARLFVSGGRTDGESTIEVAHEALFSEWPEAREWFKQNDDLIRLHDRVSTAAHTWNDDRRPADRLAYEGRPLNDVRELLARAQSREVQLDPVELAFAQASIARFDAAEQARIERERAERRRLKRAAVAFASLAAVAVVFAGISWIYRERAMAERTTAQSTLDLLVGMFDQVSPRVALGRDVTVKEVMQLNEKTIGTRLEGKDEILARVLRAMAEVYTALGDAQKSIALLKRVLEMQATFDAGADERAATLTSLGYAHSGAFEDDQALVEFQRAVEMAESNRLSPSRLTEALAGQAAIYLWTEPEKGRALFERALMLDVKHEGASSYEARRDEIGIARSWSHERKYLKALPLLDDLRKRTIAATGGEGNPDVAEISNLMATAHWNEGNIPAAQRDYQHALDVLQAVYEKDDPEVANALNNVARLELEQCGLEQAEVRLEESLRIQREKIRTPQPLAMFSLTNLALIRMQEGNLDVARDLLSEAGQMLTTNPDEAIAFDMRAGEAWLHVLAAEIEMSNGGGGDAYLEAVLNRAETLLTAALEPEDGWRFAVLQLTRARFLERTRPLEAREAYLEALRKYQARWPQGSLFSQIALERIAPLYTAHEKPLQERQIGSMRGCPPASIADPL